MNNTVTVLIPTYKRPVKLKRAIESVLAQTYTDLKVIVCDNASEDETADVVYAIMQCDRRVVYVQHAKNIGMNANFNFAVSKVDTPFFTMLTDDDYQLPNYLQDAMRGFEQYPQIACSIVSAPTILESGEMMGDQVCNWPKEGLYEPGEAMGELISGQHPILTACVFRKSLQQVIKFEDRFAAISDLPVLAKILSNYPLCLSKKVGLYFLRHDNNAGNEKIPIESILASWQSIREILEQTDKNSSPFQKKLQVKSKKLLSARYFKLLLRAVSEQNKRAFSSVFIELQCLPMSLYRLSAQVLYQLTRLGLLMCVMGYLLRLLMSLRKIYFRLGATH